MLSTLRRASRTEWLLLCVSLWFAARYFWLLDDAFIYFRYADNLVFLGRGLVYNAGEYVEGFTSPLWMLTISLLRLTRLDYWTLCSLVAVASCAGSWLLHVRIRYALSGEEPCLHLPLAACAAHYGIASYFSSGLETPLLIPLTLGFALLALCPNSHALSWALGVAPLVRPELVLIWIGYLVLLPAVGRRFDWRLLVSGAALSGGWLCFRVYYYADFLPNTFYLKDETNFAQGLRYLANSSEAHSLAGAFVVVVSLVLALHWKSLSSPSARLPHVRARAVMVMCALVLVLYVLRAGGDMLYFRFLIVPFLLALVASSGILERAWLSWSLPTGRWQLTSATLAITLFFGWGYPAQLRQHPLWIESGDQESMQKVHGISESAWHREHPELRLTSRRAAEDKRQRARYRAATDAQLAGDRLISEGWCENAWQQFDAYVVHSWGLTEPTLAHSDVETERPGHKYRLLELARDVARARTRAEPLPNALPFRGRGLMRRAQRTGHAAPWIMENLETIERLEWKMYNRHRFAENLALCLSPVPKIEFPRQTRRPAEYRARSSPAQH